MAAGVREIGRALHTAETKPRVIVKCSIAAAELGHGHAQLMLARYLASGAAGKPSPVEARLWLERAAAQGVPDAEADSPSSPLRCSIKKWGVIPPF
jgi:hypothetical protein